MAESEPRTGIPFPRRAARALAACAGLVGAAAACAAAAEPLEEIVVTARLREAPLVEVPASVSVIGSATIRARAAQHLEEVLATAPNVNFNLGSSRARFVQIRGIGERSQYVDPVDPSVGLYIDGIDFSGLGNAGTLFDAAQVEVLRGPQGTAFGASAMAGLVQVRSAAPPRTPEARVRAGASAYGGRTLGLSAGSPLGAHAAGRFALEQHRSDGYLRNTWLGRDDTNAIDERTARLRLAWEPAPALSFGLSALGVDSDNGYDAFSLDNGRRTRSDEPGRDRQRSLALALDAARELPSGLRLEAVATGSDTDADYGYDEDWSFPGLCTGTPCEGWEYASTDRYLRTVRGRSLDLRALSPDGGALRWVAGVYGWRRDNALERRFLDFAAGVPARFDSDYDAAREAAYAEFTVDAGERLRLGAGLRAERFSADYDDSLEVRARPGEALVGGQASAQYALGGAGMAYALLARGYKPGGVNGEAIGKARQAALAPSIIAFLEQRTEFASESLWNLEFGWRARAADGSAWADVALFAMEREDVQLKAWYNEGPQFVGYTDNAAGGRNRGAELELGWRPAPALSLGLGLGLLETRIDGFVVNDPDRGLVRRSARDQAQAPSWQFHASADWDFAPRLYARLEWEGRDAYYVSDSDDQRTRAYRLLHAAVGYRGARLEASAWIRNLLDEEYAVHGFYFGNDPRTYYANTAYWQWGAPRVAGLTIDYRLGE